MRSEQHFDAVVLGGGMAGLPLALKLGSKGLKVALIERDKLGGTCLNRGCIPSKTMIASANVAHHTRRADAWGITVDSVRVDLGRVVDRKDELVGSILRGAQSNVSKNEHVRLIRGEANFIGPKLLTVNGQTISGEKVFINTGTRNRLPHIAGLDEVPYLDSTTAMELRELPTHLLIVGGGYIGVEFAQMYRRFGSRVTVVQRADQVLPQEDADIADALKGVLEKEGIAIHLEASATTVERQGAQIRLTGQRKGAPLELFGSHLLVATGRQPNTDMLNLQAAGVETDAHGFVLVNDRLETSAEGVWALGDVRGGEMFTHTARDDARIVYENVVKGADLSTRGRVVPYAVFSDPQLGRVGLNERQARAKGYALKIGRYEGRKVAKARAIGEAEGLIKVIADAASDKLLGACVLLANGAEVVHELIPALKLGAKFTDLTDMLHIHPTLAEGVSSALGGVHYEEGI